jgi:hypothetical protein
MKIADVVVGQRYRCQVSGRPATVRITEIKHAPPAPWGHSTRPRTLIFAINETTGRKIMLRSAQRLRVLVEG